jgi:hypothetical protein
LDAVGHASAFGEWSSLSPLEAVDGRERRGARIELDRGAAQMLRVVRSDKRRPIEDVVAVDDGREVGRTDKSGRIVLRADDESAKIVFRWKEWRMLDAANFSGMARRNAPFERTIRLEVPRNERRRR